jgi:hypothetical protein
MQYSPADEDARRQSLGHVRRVELCEVEGRLAQLAVLLLRVRQPLHQAVLVHELDAAAALARIEERLVSRPFASAYSAGVHILTASLRMFDCDIICRRWLFGVGRRGG